MTDEIALRFLAAQAVARQAGRLALAYRADPTRHAVKSKSLQDVVSAADGAAEALIVQNLTAAFPGDVFLGEEGGATGLAQGARFLWVIDPIDGTANYVRGLPGWCVSIALLAGGAPMVGVVYDPVAGELYAACAGRGASRNGEPIRASAVREMTAATIAVGFSYRLPATRHVAHVDAILAQQGEYRRTGSGALSMAYVADGRVDGYIEGHINAWDVLAGLVLVREAGGWTNDFLGHDGLARGNAIVAAAPGLRDALLALARATGTPGV